jgi:cytochrome c-type biogenesis protein CcmF
MRLFGEACLLISLVSTGYGGFLAVLPSRLRSRTTQRIAMSATLVGAASLSLMVGILAWALVSRDFRFEYVAQYASRLLPWHYCLSAPRLGQAGSLLLWRWVTAILTILLKLVPALDDDLRLTASVLGAKRAV